MSYVNIVDVKPTDRKGITICKIDTDFTVPTPFIAVMGYAYKNNRDRIVEVYQLLLVYQISDDTFRLAGYLTPSRFENASCVMDSFNEAVRIWELDNGASIIKDEFEGMMEQDTIFKTT
jgi:hypothetical protein